MINVLLTIQILAASPNYPKLVKIPFLMRMINKEYVVPRPLKTETHTVYRIDYTIRRPNYRNNLWDFHYVYLQEIALADQK